MDHRQGRTSARVILLVGILLGLGNLLYILFASRGHLAIDYVVYHLAGAVALDGGNFYAAVPEGLADYFHYVYPPITVLGFVPLSLFAWKVGFAIHTALTVVAGLAGAWLIVRYIERVGGDALPWVDRGLIAAFVVASVHSMPSLVFGQVNHHLVAALALGFLALDREREVLAGTAFGLAAFVKVFPAAVGIWLLRRRAWRAIAAAVGTAVVGFALGLVVFGLDISIAYVESAILPRFSPDGFAGGLAPEATYLTIRRPISVLLPTVDPSLYGLLALVVLGPPIAYLYRTIEDREDRLVSIMGTMAAILLFFPSFPIYVVVLYFPLLPLLYLLDPGRSRQLLVAGALIASIAIRWDDVEVALAAADLSESLIASVLEPAFTVATPGLVGVLLILSGCLVHRREKYGAQFGQR